MSVRDTQQPAYFGVLMPLAALALLVWLMI